MPTGLQADSGPGRDYEMSCKKLSSTAAPAAKGWAQQAYALRRSASMTVVAPRSWRAGVVINAIIAALLGALILLFLMGLIRRT